MSTLTILKRSTAVAALMALPLLAPVAGAQSQQSQGQPSQNQQTQAQTGSEGPSGNQAAGGNLGPANQTGIVTEGKEGTESGPAPDQAPTGAQAGHDQSGQQGQAGQQAGQQGSTGQHAQSEKQSGASGNQAGNQDSSDGGEDRVVAKVGDHAIRQSDLMTVIGALPPQLQQQPPETLVPIALNQLVMRQLILDKAKEAGLDKDPEVLSMAQGAPQRAKENAMVQVWLGRQLGDAVTDQKIQQTYDAVKQQMGDQTPPMEALRPQIEQELRQQAFLDLSKDLQANADITLYGPDGQAVTQ